MKPPEEKKRHKLKEMIGRLLIRHHQQKVHQAIVRLSEDNGEHDFWNGMMSVYESELTAWSHADPDEGGLLGDSDSDEPAAETKTAEPGKKEGPGRFDEEVDPPERSGGTGKIENEVLGFLDRYNLFPEE